MKKLEDTFQIIDLESLDNTSAVAMSYHMLSEHFPKSYLFMKNKNPKTLQEFKEILYTIDKHTLDQETKKYIVLLKIFSSQDAELMKDFNQMDLESDTPQSVFNRYKSASWVMTTLQYQKDEIKKSKEVKMQ